MSAVATNRPAGSTAATEILVLEPVAQRLGLAPILLVPGELTLGSSPDCQIQLTVPGVQPQHCILNCSRSRVSIRALDRRTWQNNLPITEGWLKIGDRLAIGPVEFRVRQAEPWDVAPVPPRELADTVATADNALAAVQSEIERDRVQAFESQLLKQIADLEAEVIRHQAAVAALVQPPAAEPNLAVAASRGGSAVPLQRESEPDVPLEVVSPRFLLLPGMISGRDSEEASLREQLEEQKRLNRQQSVDVSGRQDALNRQFIELAAQWDQLRALISEQETAALERSRREEQLEERERRCANQEFELGRRSQQHSDERTKVADRWQQLQSEAAQLTSQSTQVAERERSLAVLARELDVRESEIEQGHQALEEREAACRAAAESAESWQRLRDETEANWAQRRQELEVQATASQTQLEALSLREQACEQLTAEVQQARQQVLADRGRLESWSQELSQFQGALTLQQQELNQLQLHLQAREAELATREADYAATAAAVQLEREHCAAEQLRLETWNTELTSSQAVFTHQQRELAAEASGLKLEAQELVLREYAWEQIVSMTQRDQEQLEAERDRLDVLHGEINTRQTELTERHHELEARAARHQANLSELAQRQHGLDQAAVLIQQNQDRLIAERQELEDSKAEIAAWRSELELHQQELATQSANWTSQIEELRERKLTWEQTVNAAELAEEELRTERYRLEAWNDELSARQVALVHQQQELQARVAEWEAARREEADSAANALTNDYSSLVGLREEFAQAEFELEQVEFDLNNMEVELQARTDELAAREAHLHQIEIECAWQQRETELHSASAFPTVPADAAAELVKLSAERDALATELFTITRASESNSADEDAVGEQLRLRLAQLAANIEDCQRQRKLLDAERRLLESDHQEWQHQRTIWLAERAELEAIWNFERKQLSADQQSLETDQAALRSHELDLSAQWETLNSERAQCEQLSHQIQQQEADLARQTEELRQRQQDLESRITQQQASAAALHEQSSAAASELAATQAALDEQQEHLRRAQQEFDREREAWEADRLAWQEQLQASTESSDAASSHVLGVLSQLDEAVQSELDRDGFSPHADDQTHHTAENVGDHRDNSDTPTAAVVDTSDPFAAIRALYTPPAPVDHASLVKDHAEHKHPELYRSLWADVPDKGPAKSEPGAELPATDEEISALSLRARLAEMFSLELSTDESAVPPPLTPDLTETAESAELPIRNATIDVDSAESDFVDQAASREPEQVDSATESVVDEYDSVESYMQRLLDRNRKSRAGEEPIAERYVPSGKPSMAPVISKSSLPANSEFENAGTELEMSANAATDSVTDSVRVPVREPVDAVKMRAGLDSLRQIANSSARHAIARSKWKKLRATVALQSLLTAGSTVIGFGILTGHWLGMLGTTLWGWAALAIGVVLGAKVIRDIRWIYYGERRPVRVLEARIAPLPDAHLQVPDQIPLESHEPELDTLAP